MSGTRIRRQVVIVVVFAALASFPGAAPQAERAAPVVVSVEEQTRSTVSLLDRAEALILDGDWGGALAACQEALVRDPVDVNAHTCAVSSLIGLGQFPAAAEALERFRRRVPSRALDVAGSLLHHWGDLWSARTVFEHCVTELQPRNPFCWVELVDSHLTRGEEERALQVVREALSRAKPGEVLDTVWDRLWGEVVFVHDRERFSRGLGRPLPVPPGAAGEILVGRLAVLRTPDGRADLPLRYEKGWPFVRARVNGKPVELLVDTGANQLALYPRAAERVGFRAEREVTVNVEGGSGTVIERSGAVRRLELGKLRLDNVPSTISSSPMTAGDGVLGVALLRDFLVDLDFPAKRLRLAPVRKPAERAFGTLPGGTYVMPFATSLRVPLIAGLVNNRLSGWFLLDTGAQGNVLDSRFLPRLALEAGVRPAPPPPGSGPMASIGIGGKTPGQYLSPLEANIGPFVTSFPHVPTVPFRIRPGIQLLGAWGFETLRDYRLILDYRRHRLYARWNGPNDPEARGVVPFESPEPVIADLIGLRWAATLSWERSEKRRARPETP